MSIVQNKSTHCFGKMYRSNGKQTIINYSTGNFIVTLLEMSCLITSILTKAKQSMHFKIRWI